jgi:hypothetical protein
MQSVDQALVTKLHEVILPGRLANAHSCQRIALQFPHYLIHFAARRATLINCYPSMITSSDQHCSQFLNVSISDEARNQATLLVANGGTWMRRATQIALPAFLSSLAGSQSLLAELLPARLDFISGTCNPLYTTTVNDWQSQTNSPRVQMTFSTAQKD